jgi:hypothetical protein
MRSRNRTSVCPAFALVFLATALHGSARAGSNNADLDCKASGTRQPVSLRGSIPGDFAEFSLTLERGGTSVSMSSPDDRINVVIELAKGVFTMAVNVRDGRELSMYAVPSSVRVKGGSQRLFDATFDAVLLTAPRPGHVGPQTSASLLHDVKMTCTLHHQI